MEKLTYFVEGNSPLCCHGAVVDILRNKSDVPIAVKCSCGEPFHLVIRDFSHLETFTIMSNTKLTREEVSLLSNERCTIDESILTF